MKLLNVDVVTLNDVLKKQTVTIEDGRFVSVHDTQVNDLGDDYTGLLMMPGFIDVHQHGTHGFDMMDGDPRSIEAISTHLVHEGTTRFLATTMTMNEAAILKALESYPTATPKGALPLGIHLEGPYISKDYPGAQDPGAIVPGTIEQFEQFQAASGGAIKLVTLAPEAQDDAFIDYLLKAGIVISMGHSAATEADVEAAIKKGIRRVTHCYNAMSPLHHRDLGLVGMTLLHDDIEAELIADGIHTSDKAIQLLLKYKADHMTLITDGIRAKGLADGVVDLGGQEVHVKDGIARLKNGALAGSTLTLDKALKNMLDNGGDLVKVSRMLSYHPARTLKVDHELGQIKSGYTADFVLVDPRLNIQRVAVNGELLI